MLYKFSFLIVFSLLIASCGNDAPESSNPEEVSAEWKKVEGGKPADELEANAVADTDVVGKVKAALTTVQQQYDKAEGKVPGLGKVTLLVDENLMLIVRNEVDGKTFETRADLKSLDPETSHIGIILDQNPGEYPGFRVPVLSGESKVLKMEGESVKSKEESLEIILASREDVERAVSAMMTAVQVAHNKL